jgi:predicted nuclease with TOPRIM domain
LANRKLGRNSNERIQTMFDHLTYELKRLGNEPSLLDDDLEELEEIYVSLQSMRESYMNGVRRNG